MIVVEVLCCFCVCHGLAVDTATRHVLAELDDGTIIVSVVVVFVIVTALAVDNATRHVLQNWTMAL